MLSEQHHKPVLVILSDIFGTEGADWIDYYSLQLEDIFKIHMYDTGKLAQIEQQILDRDERHQYFLSGGLETAVVEIQRLELDPVWILGFSIGGVIAWKAALETLQVINLIAVSSTRLRFETQKPEMPIHLFYGANDIHRPDDKWLIDSKAVYEICMDAYHEMYKSEYIAKYICNHIITCYRQHIKPK